MATICNVSSKYKDIVSKCILLKSGSPTVYQLSPENQMFGTLTRKTVGQHSPNRVNKTILLVGETGTGKSTLINALLNCAMGVEFKDNIWFEIVENENRCQTESQTSDVIVYEIFGFEDKPLPYSLTIIDTPGYGDTREIKNDDNVSQRLLDLFRSDHRVCEISAVGLVVKASDNRLSDRLSYVFHSVMSLFGSDLEKNIVTLITNSNGMTPENVLQAIKGINLKCATNEKNQPVHFMFDNCQGTERTDENEFNLEYAWRVTKRGMSGFSSFLENSASQKLTKTVEVLNTSVGLTACIQNLKDRIKFIELKQKEVEQSKVALETNQEEMEKNKDFVITVDEPYKDKQPINGDWWGFSLFYNGATCCTVCEENCHYPGCTLAWSPKNCEVMKGGSCTSCTGMCSVSKHVKENWIYVAKTKKVQKTLVDIKEKYEKNKKQSEHGESILKGLENEMKDLMAKKNQLVEQSYQHILRLEQIALNVNSASTYIDFNFLIEMMKEKGDTEKVQKLQQMESCRNKDKGVIESIKYRFGKLTSLVKPTTN